MSSLSQSRLALALWSLRLRLARAVWTLSDPATLHARGAE